MFPSPIPEKEDKMAMPRSKVVIVHVTGPLAPYATEFESNLEDCGFTPLTRVRHLQVMVHLSRWLQARQLGVGELTCRRVEQYLAERRSAGYTAFCSRRSVAPLLGSLGSLGLLPDEEPGASESRVDVLVAGFSGYLHDERGLATSTVAAYVARARRFVTGYTDDGDLSEVTAADVTRAVLHECDAVSVGALQYFVTALRSFLRYCTVAGLIETDLSAAALAVTGRRRSSLPKGISRTDAQALLRSCDRRYAAGRRDYAIILTLLRLGLRAGEVAALSLGDLDWRAGQIVVHGKGGRVDRLPLPVDVGEAIAGYLRRGRPTITRREVFLRATAPRAGLSREAVSWIVRRACVRAGLTPVGAHRLRHTLACEMVRAGVPLPEISQVLRHRAGASTTIYARVDVDQLRGLARPWPDGTAQ